MSDQALRDQFVSIIVGSTGALSLSRRLFLRYGIVSHLLMPRLPLFHRLCPWVRHHAIPDRLDTNVLLMALTDLARELASEDRTPLLFWCADEPLSLNDESRLRLESQLILCQEDKLDELASFQGGLTR